MKKINSLRQRLKNQTFRPSLFMLLAILFCSSSQISAQIPKELPTVSTGKVNAGSLLTQLANGIKPSSFTDAWAGGKTNWLASAGKIASTPGMVEGITSLTKFIKPAMFKEAFKPQNLLQTATKAKSMADAAGLLKSLQGGLKPEAMVSSWAGKESAWQSALSMLK